MEQLEPLINWCKAHPEIVGGAAVGLLVVLFVLRMLIKKRRLAKLQKSQKFCRQCGGTGKNEGKKCELCGGTGIPPICPICDGDGRVEAEKRCSYCMGTGVALS
ncbi:MAG: hypothetical protein ACYTGX_02825 [Planctomycetota bacterium]|jgi:hypothetical protein